MVEPLSITSPAFREALKPLACLYRDPSVRIRFGEGTYLQFLGTNRWVRHLEMRLHRDGESAADDSNFRIEVPYLDGKPDSKGWTKLRGTGKLFQGRVKEAFDHLVKTSDLFKWFKETFPVIPGYRERSEHNHGWIDLAKAIGKQLTGAVGLTTWGYEHGA